MVCHKPVHATTPADSHLRVDRWQIPEGHFWVLFRKHWPRPPQVPLASTETTPPTPSGGRHRAGSHARRRPPDRYLCFPVHPPGRAKLLRGHVGHAGYSPRRQCSPERLVDPLGHARRTSKPLPSKRTQLLNREHDHALSDSFEGKPSAPRSMHSDRTVHTHKGNRHRIETSARQTGGA